MPHREPPNRNDLEVLDTSGQIEWLSEFGIRVFFGWHRQELDQTADLLRAGARICPTLDRRRV